jgi:UDP-N-acetylmuramyl pentapeptide phosphotransferase/UDP-N-acetylglucosamine-1-phosphate transferase
MEAEGLAVLAATAAASLLGTRALIPLLRRRGLFDRPNERSLHAVPVPRGGGIAVVAVVLAAWVLLAFLGRAPAATLGLVLAGLFLATVSWIDDWCGLSPALRLLAQAAAVGAGFLALSGESAILFVPAFLPLAAAALAWLWFINLFNFMDGIDGLAASEAAAVGLALFFLAGDASSLLAAAIAGAALGFLVWNWSPARIFLGDVGSVSLGYLLGFLLLDRALRGGWLVALILPLYFLADASLTLARRLLRGERVWQAHREHFYQRAVQMGLGHAAVVKRVLVADLLLIACAYAAAEGWGAAALGLAALVVAALIVLLARGR